jgi:hypothetical protein
MPAKPLYQRLKEKTKGRLVISDVTQPLSEEAKRAGIKANNEHVDYYWR